MPRNLEHRRGFTLVELLVVISIIAIIAGLVVPILLEGQGQAVKIECTNNLRNIYGGALTYSNKTHAFPLAVGGSDVPRAHESLNVLVRSNSGRDLPAKIFACPAGGQTEPVLAAGQEFLQLDEDTLSYAWVAKRTRNFGKAVNLSSDKYVDDWEGNQGHEHEVMILRTDNSVDTIETDALDDDTGLPAGLVR